MGCLVELVEVVGVVVKERVVVVIMVVYVVRMMGVRERVVVRVGMRWL